MTRGRQTGLRRAALAALVVTAGLLMGAVTASRPAPAPAATRPPAIAGGSTYDAVLAATSGTTLPTAANPTTATTVVPIQNQLPAPPVTLPLTVHQASTRLNPLLAKLSLAGFALFLLLLVIQFVLTRPRRRGRWTL